MINVCCLCKQVIARQLLQQLIELGIVMLKRLRLTEVDCFYPVEGSLEPFCKQGESGVLPSRQPSSVEDRVCGQSCSIVDHPPPTSSKGEAGGDRGLYGAVSCLVTLSRLGLQLVLQTVRNLAVATNKPEHPAELSLMCMPELASQSQIRDQPVGLPPL